MQLKGRKVGWQAKRQAGRKEGRQEGKKRRQGKAKGLGYLFYSLLH
jgi:hypothetical protein